jgi:hypothetical protein
VTKQDEFLWIVQTAILANAVNLGCDPESREKYRDVYSSLGVRIVMREAVRAGAMIPIDMDAGDAADDFCNWMFRNHQESILKDNPSKRTPHWFAR